MTVAVGIDIGGTLLKAVAVTADGALLGRTSRPVRDGTDGVAEWIARANDAIVELVGKPNAGSRAIGVCAPGLASRDGTSIAHLPGRLRGIEGVKWGDVLTGNPRVTVLNDAHAALVGEAWVGAARGRRDVVLLTLGTGVGGAVMTDGRLLRGARGRAGHVGHMSLNPDGPRSITGMPGAVEVLVGDCTIQERTEGRFASTADLIAAHLAGDAFATGVWGQSIRALGCAIASYINLFDPEIVVVGGGIAKGGDALFVPLRAQVEKVEWRPGGHGVPIVPAELGEWAGAIGAAREAMRNGMG